MLLVKLGGSVITNKARPLSAKRGAVRAIAQALRRAGEPAVIVHGGGSFGHHWSVRYGMHTRPQDYSTRGVAVVKESMVALNKIVLGEMIAAKASPYPIPPAALVDSRGRMIEAKAREAAGIAMHSMTPVTYGDALWRGGARSYILSGDALMTMLAGILRPRLCIFAMNVDGLYDRMGGSLMYEAGRARAAMGPAVRDVTGGMARKVKEAKKISSAGVRVFFVNGNRPERITDAVRGRRFEGTVFGARRNG